MMSPQTSEGQRTLELEPHSKTSQPGHSEPFTSPLFLQFFNLDLRYCSLALEPRHGVVLPSNRSLVSRRHELRR